MIFIKIKFETLSIVKRFLVEVNKSFIVLNDRSHSAVDTIIVLTAVIKGFKSWGIKTPFVSIYSLIPRFASILLIFNLSHKLSTSWSPSKMDIPSGHFSGYRIYSSTVKLKLQPTQVSIIISVINE